MSILQAVIQFVELATYKCERPSGENASECLSILADYTKEAKAAVAQEAVIEKVLAFGIYMTGNGSMAKIYIIQTVQKALTTAEGAPHGVLTC